MKVSGERYFPQVGSHVFAPYEPFVSYEHWHRYCYALPFVTGKSVLDIASGEGYGSALLADSAALVYGVDISEEAVQHARESYVRGNLHFLQGAAEAIPIPGEHCFDVIVSFETIEHLDAPTQERFAAEITRLLKPDGVLLVSTPNRTTYSPAGLQGNRYHLHEFTKDEFVAFLCQRFAHVRVLSQHVYPISYIWNADGPTGSLVEYQMNLEDGRFRPGLRDEKEVGYMIAVCAHEAEHAAAANSILIDLSETAFTGMPDDDRRQTTSLFIDTGAGFRAEEVVCEETVYHPEFALRFTLDPSTPVRQLRWDPLEMSLCRVRLRQVDWQDAEGREFRLDLGRVASNGLRRDEATFEFETLDPMVFLPVSGSVARVTIEGECIASDAPTTLAGLERVAQARADRLALQDQELSATRRQVEDEKRLTADYERLLARQAEELEAARRQLAVQEGSIVDLSRDLDDRQAEIQSLKRRVLDLEEGSTRLAASLHAIVNSKRWIVINGVRSALYFPPHVIGSTWRRIMGGAGFRSPRQRRSHRGGISQVLGHEPETECPRLQRARTPSRVPPKRSRPNSR
jgi:SAM-dependent methyltransferase